MTMRAWWRAWWMAAGLFVLAMAGASAAPRSVWPEYKWCYIEPPYYIQHCHYDSIEECRLEIIGMGGYCNLNPRYVEPAPQPEKPRRRRAR
jgi:hypothetical protein